MRVRSPPPPGVAAGACGTLGAAAGAPAAPSSPPPLHPSESAAANITTSATRAPRGCERRVITRKYTEAFHPPPVFRSLVAWSFHDVRHAIRPPPQAQIRDPQQIAQHPVIAFLDRDPAPLNFGVDIFELFDGLPRLSALQELGGYFDAQAQLLGRGQRLP